MSTKKGWVRLAILALAIWCAAWTYIYFDASARAQRDLRIARATAEFVSSAPTGSTITMRDYLREMEQRSAHLKLASNAVWLALAPLVGFVLAGGAFWVYRGFSPPRETEPRASALPGEPIRGVPPLTAGQLNTIVGALQIALVRYPLLLQLRRWDENGAPLDHDDLRDLRDALEATFQETKVDPTVEASELAA